MIVKNETKVLPRLFASLHKYISYYVIVDTGSQDQTPTLIKELMDGYGIRGEVHFDEWDQNFGRSRQVALDAALKAAQTERFQWVFFIDADEELGVTDPDWHTKLVPGISYRIAKKHGALKYSLPNLLDIRTSQFRWRRPVHNHIEHIGGPIKWQKLDSVWIIYHSGEGAKSHGLSQHDKYMRDAGILQKEIDKDPKDRWARYYYAQSLKDAGEYAQALEAYKERVELKGWDQEMYVALVATGECLEHVGTEQQVLDAYLKAYEYRPARRDALFSLVRYLRKAKRNELAYLFAKHATAIPRNNDELFVNDAAHGWLMLDDLSVAAALTGRHEETLQVCKELLAVCPDEQKQRIERNRDLSERILKQPKAKEEEMVSVSQPQQIRITLKGPLVVLCAGDAWKPWGPKSLQEGALGGSETAAIRMAQELSRDHSVIVFCACSEEGEHDGVMYLDNNKYAALLAQKPPIRLLVVSRYPSYLRYAPYIQETWLWLHDTEVIGDKRLIRGDTRVLSLSNWHRQSLKYNWISVTSNGITPVPLEKETVPLRFVYSSSALRGLDNLLAVWPQIRAEFPSAELYVFSSVETPFIKNKAPQHGQRIKAMAEQPGVVWRGPVDQNTLALELQQADVWMYPTQFYETYCITAVEMQLYNVLCFYYPVAALVETIGDRGIQVTKDNAMATLKEWLNDRPRVKAKKAAAREWALKQTWTKVADQWKGWMSEREEWSMPMIEIKSTQSTVQKAIEEGHVSQEADFLTLPQADEIASLCAEHGAVWKGAPVEWTVVHSCPVSVNLYSYFQVVPEDADLLMLGCLFYDRSDGNLAHLQQCITGTAPWFRVVKPLGGAFAYAFRGGKLAETLPLLRAVDNFNSSLVIYVLIPNAAFHKRDRLVYCGAVIP